MTLYNVPLSPLDLLQVWKVGELFIGTYMFQEYDDFGI